MRSIPILLFCLAGCAGTPATVPVRPAPVATQPPPAAAPAPVSVPPPPAPPGFRERLGMMLDGERDLDAALAASLGEDVAAWLAQQERRWAESRPQLRAYLRLGMVESVRSRFRFAVVGTPVIRRSGDPRAPARAEVQVSWENAASHGVGRLMTETGDIAGPSPAHAGGLPAPDPASDAMRLQAQGALAKAIAAADAASQAAIPQPERGSRAVVMILDRGSLRWSPEETERAARP